MIKVSFIYLLLFISISYPQALLFEENFDYSTGFLSSVTTNWSDLPDAALDIQVFSGSLSYNNYPSSGIGNKIVLDGGRPDRSGVIRPFTTQSTAGTTVYFSFLLYVIHTSDLNVDTSDGDYFCNFQNSGLTESAAYVHIKRGSGATKYILGLAKSSSANLDWYSGELDVGTTYLIVVAYTFVSGSDNDAVKLWINPDLSGPEPAADLDINSGADAANLGYIQFRQKTKSGDMEIDGLRLATGWSLAPLPVELSSFSAVPLDGVVKLEWRTETEVSNYGFKVERANGDFEFRNSNFETIGFVKGHGNSNSPKDYSFIDDLTITPDLTHTLRYRLKQIDTDGSFEYSKIIEVDIGVPGKYELSQNYPNPFNPATTIKYLLPESGNVKLSVYNLLGEQVAELVNGFKESGVHTINFSAAGGSSSGGTAFRLESGVYIYKLEVNGSVQSRKMMLVK